MRSFHSLDSRPPVFAALLALMLVACGGTAPVEDRTITLDQGDETSDSVSAEPTAGGGDDSLNVGEDACETDADCVPADCCHASSCVAQEHAPSCGDAMCTQECRYGTLDCGGGCLCHEGRCAARLSEPPAGLESVPAE